MAQLDVSDVLLDPDFIDNVSLIQRTEVVNSKGKTELTETATIATVASVQPASGKDIKRLPEGLQSSDIRAFYIKAEIRTDGAGRYPDVISFNGGRYLIKLAEPWLNYGQGWNKALCVREDVSL